MRGDRLARDARRGLEGGGAESRVARREREAGGLASALGARGDLEGARVRLAGELRDGGLAARHERGGVDALAALRVLGLGGVEQPAGVADERVVADGLERIAHHGVDWRPAAATQASTVVNASSSAFKSPAGAGGSTLGSSSPASNPSAFSTLARGAGSRPPGRGVVPVAARAIATKD